MFNSFFKWWKRTPSTIPDDLSVDRALYEVVWKAWNGGFTVSSDTARSRAAYVAIASSLGLITTQEPDNSFGRSWYVTEGGLKFLQSYWETK